jgi:hypothetical protein
MGCLAFNVAHGTKTTPTYQQRMVHPSSQTAIHSEVFHPCYRHPSWQDYYLVHNNQLCNINRQPEMRKVNTKLCNELIQPQCHHYNTFWKKFEETLFRWFRGMTFLQIFSLIVFQKICTDDFVEVDQGNC